MIRMTTNSSNVRCHAGLIIWFRVTILMRFWLLRGGIRNFMDDGDILTFIYFRQDLPDYLDFLIRPSRKEGRIPNRLVKLGTSIGISVVN